MTIIKRFDCVATRQYTSRTNNEIKKQYINLGTAVLFDDGNLLVELNTIPVGQWWHGKFNLYEQKPRTGTTTQQPNNENGSSGDDDTPF